MKKEMATTLVFLPGKSHGQRTLAGCSPWGGKELDMTEHTQKVKSAIGFGIRQTYILIPHLPKGEVMVIYLMWLSFSASKDLQSLNSFFKQKYDNVEASCSTPWTG